MAGRERDGKPLEEVLSAAEQRVFRELLAGATDEEVAERLGIGIATVRYTATATAPPATATPTPAAAAAPPPTPEPTAAATPTPAARAAATATPVPATPTGTPPATPTATVRVAGSVPDWEHPNLTFWGDVPEAEEAFLRARIADMVAFFDERFGIRVPNLDIHVAARMPALKTTLGYETDISIRRRCTSWSTVRTSRP